MPDLETARGWYPANDAVHGFDHILRVYRLASRIAQAEGADLEIVQAAALLHDAHGAQANGEDDTLRTAHQHSSASFARQILLAEDWTDERITAVEHCIRAHRFRDQSEQPQTLEARVLFDADKLDAIGAIGVARSIGYATQDGMPAYSEPSALFLETGQKQNGELHSSYHEFVFKLRKLKDRLYTPTGRALAEKRHQVMADFYEQLRLEYLGER